MNVLIVGGAGFIGGHLAAAMRDRGDDVRIFDKKIHVWEDAKDIEALTRAMRGVDLVVHLAANADIAKAATDPMIDFTDGTVLTQNVLEAMRLTDVYELVYASGSGVYGEYRGEPFEEVAPLLPISPYGASKVASEMLIRAYSYMFDMRADIFRFANVVGPRQTHGVGYDFVRRLKKDPRHLVVMGNGRQTKNYLHVEDACAAMLLGIDRDVDGVSVYNVSPDDAGLSVRQIAEMAKVECGADDAEVVYGIQAEGWRGDVPVIQMKSDKIRALGWAPQDDSESAMRDALTAMVHECG